MNSFIPTSFKNKFARSAAFLVVLIILMCTLAFTVSAEETRQSNPMIESIGPIGIRTLVVANVPKNPEVVYAGTDRAGLYRSMDGGHTWQRIGNEIGTLPIFGLVVTHTHVYAATYGGGVYRSSDDGSTWQSINMGINQYEEDLLMLSIFRDDNSGSLYVGTERGAVYRSDNDGESWQLIHVGSRPVSQLAQANTGALFIGSSSAEITISRDRDKIWKTLVPVPDTTVTDFAFGSDGIYISTYGKGVFWSGDGGETWEPHNAGGGTYLTSLVWQQGQLFAAGPSGLYASSDGGLTWHQRHNGLPNTFLFEAGLFSTGERLLLFTTNEGLFISEDAGLSWKGGNDGLLGARLIITDLMMASGKLYALSWGGGAYRFVGNNQWKSIDAGLLFPPVHGIVSDKGTLVVNTWGFIPYRSIDGGDKWEQVDFHLGDVRTLATMNSIILAGTWGDGIYKSSDDGINWEKITPGPGVEYISTLLPNPAQPATIFAGTWGGGVYQSLDNGESWQAMNNGLRNMLVKALAKGPSDGPLLASAGGVLYRFDKKDGWVRTLLSDAKVITFDSVDPKLVYAGDDNGDIIVSRDHGTSWQTLVLLDAGVNDLLSDPKDPWLYVGTDGESVYKVDISGYRRSWLERNIIPIGGVGFTSLGLIFFTLLITLSVKNGIPMGILFRLRPSDWLSAGDRYRPYQERWTQLSSLEQLILLLINPSKTITPSQFHEMLEAQKTPVDLLRLERALESLTHAGFLFRYGEGYRPTDGAVTRILQLHQTESGRNQLFNLVREEHPLIVETQIFFNRAGFTLSKMDNDPLAFICTPNSSWEHQFSTPLYMRLFPIQPFDRLAVTDLYETARITVKDIKVVFAVVDQTPSDSGWIEIAALRTEGIQVIPIDDVTIQQGLERQEEHQTFEMYLGRFLSQRRDLYYTTHAVSDRLNFFGRESRANKLLETLTGNQPIALIGLRKMGKSSLLQYMRDKATFPIAHVDLEAGADLPGLCDRILQSWRRSIRVKLKRVEWAPPRLADDVSTNFVAITRDLLEHLSHQGHDGRLGIFLDEIEVIIPHTQSGIDAPDPNTLDRYLKFSRLLRGLSEETGRLSLMVFGVDPYFIRKSGWAEQQNPFYQFFREEYLGPLHSEDCVQMVRNIGRQMGIVFDDDAVAFVAEISGSHPYLARRLCHSLVQSIGEDTISQITLPMVRQASESYLRDPSTSVTIEEDLWRGVTDPILWLPPQILENQALLKSLAKTGPQSEKELLESSRDRKERDSLIIELEHRAILSRENQKLKIQFGLFRNWIQRYKL